MADSALYFPHINVPAGQWLFRTLLYWDTIKSIVPLEYLDEPGLHTPEMREMLHAGLVEAVVPGYYIAEMERFGENFLKYIDRSIAHRARYRSAAGRLEERVRVHIEKMGGVADGLVARGLANRETYQWYRVEPWAGRAFMAYLAGVLGKMPDVNADPVTAERQSLDMIGGSRNPVLQRRVEARSVLMRRLLPRPTANLSIADIARFKANNAEALKKFRRAIEMQCIDIAQVEHAGLRQERATLVAEELHEEIGNVAEAMRIQWGHVVMGGLWVVLGALAGYAATPADQPLARISAGSSLGSAIYQMFDPLRTRREALQKPMAYGALATVFARG